ncbi:MAG TPA: hypothetical protein VH142_21595 [Polyangiaceae bacterium]|jgi:hypothetical protein|nr:hypothetical protein [Polyangiaceae bacterium]
MKTSKYFKQLQRIPTDFFADPDGDWSYESLVAAAGFSALGVPVIGALSEPWNGHPEGAAVVAAFTESGPRLAIVECAQTMVHAA